MLLSVRPTTWVILRPILLTGTLSKSPLLQIQKCQSQTSFLEGEYDEEILKKFQISHLVASIDDVYVSQILMENTNNEKKMEEIAKIWNFEPKNTHTTNWSRQSAKIGLFHGSVPTRMYPVLLSKIFFCDQKQKHYTETEKWK